MKLFKANEKIDISVIVPVIERCDDLRQLFECYAAPLRARGVSFEFIFVIDHSFRKAYEELRALKEEYAEIKVLKFARNFFESIALMAGFEQAQGEKIITLASYFQIEPEAVNAILEKLDEGYELVVTRRFPRQDSVINRLQAGVFHWLVKTMSGCSYKDMACGLRGMTREVATSLELTGDMHRFIPILAYQKGFKVVEVNAPQRKEDKRLRVYGFGVYIRRVIDVVSLFFLIKFTRKPLRFFGLIGINVFTVGTVITLYMAYIRIFLGYGLANRPLLLLGLLLMVMGVQIASLGLLGELIIFTHARDIKEYHVAEVLE